MLTKADLQKALDQLPDNAAVSFAKAGQAIPVIADSLEIVTVRGQTYLSLSGSARTGDE
jgi:hypothetical protein